MKQASWPEHFFEAIHINDPAFGRPHQGPTPLPRHLSDLGRLWVTESVEYPFAAPPGRKPKDRVKILEDFEADGRARKVTVFADGLNIPIGVLPLSDGAIVFSIPNIYRLSRAWRCVTSSCRRQRGWP